MHLKYITLGIIILLCAHSAHADTYTIDKREYVSNWCTAPYNKIVAFFPPSLGRNAYYPQPTCTAQYVAPDIILTALHCVYYEGNPQTFQISNCKNPSKRWDAKIISTGASTRDADWALLRIQDSAGYSDEYFDVSPTTPENSIINNAGWGMIRRLSDQEITEIKNILRRYIAEHPDVSSLNELYLLIKTTIDVDEPSLSGRGNYPTQLKANTQCNITGTHASNYCRQYEQSDPNTCQQYRKYFDATCNAQHGNSGGPYFLGNTLYGIVSRGGIDDKFTLATSDIALKTVAFYDALTTARAASPVIETQTPPVQQTPVAQQQPIVAEPDSQPERSTTPATEPTPLTPTPGTTTVTITPDQTPVETPVTQQQPIVAEPDSQPERSTPPATGSTPLTPTPGTTTVTITPDQTPVETPVITPNVTEEEITASETDILNQIKQDIDNASPADVLNMVIKMNDINQLRKQYEAAKAREQSLPNKILGAAGIGATGIGGMMLASGLAEQNADEDAEQDMRAYLATFRCDYGQGRNIVGGQKNVQLPGASELIQYTTEYKQLATNLKADKEALGMLPGIESEVVFDSATTGLYDDVSIGTQKGAFTSLSRALLDENSADAAEWQEQTQSAKNKTKTGAITAGVGAGGSAIGNLIINHKSDDNKTEGQKTETNTVQ